MDPSWRGRLERLGLRKAVGQNRSGSPATLALRPGPDLGRIRTIPAIQSLHRRGLTIIRAKRAIEAVVERGLAILAVPKVEDVSALARDLADCGVATALVEAGEVDVRRIRERSGLTLEEFALRFGLDVDTFKNWESGRRAMPLAVRSYMRVIDRMPEQAGSALETAVGAP